MLICLDPDFRIVHASTLFGHVRGAFTGAVRDRAGRVDLAAGGTLFLDEIGDLPLPLQVKLLRFLQEKTFERVGDSHTRKADVRIIAATNVDLRKAVARFLFARVAARHGREMRFSPDSIRALLRYSWPGNVRELENAIEYAVAVGRGEPAAGQCGCLAVRMVIRRRRVTPCGGGGHRGVQARGGCRR